MDNFSIFCLLLFFLISQYADQNTMESNGVQRTMFIKIFFVCSYKITPLLTHGKHIAETRHFGYGQELQFKLSCQLFLIIH